jgi:Rad3-related DNA helicase
MPSLDPRSLGLPHSQWRPSQFQAFRKASQIYNGFIESGSSGATFAGFQLCVGVGKSGVAKALSSLAKTTVLVQNHGLLDQYKNGYGLDIIKGKQEYPCVLKTKVNTWKSSYSLMPMASDCHFKDMKNCPDANSCPYQIARNIALQSNRMACTYAYASLSDAVKERDGILIFDEAHTSVEQLLKLSSFEMDELEREKYGFPTFPLIDYGPSGDGDILNGKSKAIIIEWLSECINEVSNKDLFDKMTPTGSKTVKVFDSLNKLFNLIIEEEDLFYKCSSKSIGDNDWRSFCRKQNQLVFSIRTLTAKNIASTLFANKKMVMLMSATIGDPQPLFGELGVEDFKFFEYPHPVPIEKRPVYSLDVPKMTKVNLDKNPSLYKIQANAITQFINMFDPKWRGIVLTSSNYKVKTLRDYLIRDFPLRILRTKEGMGVSERLNSFIDSEPGTIMVDTLQGLGTGTDLRDERGRFAIVGGINHSNPADRFQSLRMSTKEGKRYAFWSAHCGTQQACGRVIRGEREYDGSYMYNVAALADGSMIDPYSMRNYTLDFKESIHEFKGTL